MEVAVFGSTILEVIIGVLFVYLLLSVLCSAIGEYLESKWNNRAKLLKKGIELLLNDSAAGSSSPDLAAQLYAHGLIRPLYRDATTLPSYIPSRTFALALWNMATGGTNAGVTMNLGEIRETIAKLPQKELRTALLTLIDEAKGDLDRARVNIEQWYESAMDRVSGWYKRRTGYIMLALGIVVSAAINADTITVATALARDSALRTAVANAAEERLAAGAPQQPQKPAGDAGTADPTAREAAAAQALDRAYADVNALGLPIGWQGWAASPDDPRRAPATFMGWVLKALGLLLTGFAVSQGAPFWFDLLNKVMVVRSTVKPKEKSAEQPSKDRPAPRTEIEAEGDKSPSKG
jgi:hypothetical protein